jgi:hypothetical protein
MRKKYINISQPIFLFKTKPIIPKIYFANMSGFISQIEAIYSTKFHNQHVRVEIISVIRVDSGKRRKR